MKLRTAARLLTLAALTVLPATIYAAPAWTVQEKAGEAVDVLRDGKVVARYMTAYDPSSKESREVTFKPYLHIMDADGKEPITKGPGGSFPHHRGIFVGWNKLKIGDQTVDRWHMKGGDQVHRKLSAQQGGGDGASFTSIVEWLGGKDEVLLSEERTFRFSPGPLAGSMFVDQTSRLKAVGGDTELGGDPEHAGLQFRASSEIDLTKTVYVFPGEQVDLKKDLDLPWFAGAFTIGGKRYSVVYLNHPSNPKGTRISAYRDYGRFGAFFTDKIAAGAEREIKVRFLISEGETPSAEVIQKAWNAYAGANEPTPKTVMKPVSAPKPAAAAPAAQ